MCNDSLATHWANCTYCMLTPSNTQQIKERLAFR